MADLDLRTDYKDDILDSSVNEKRKYNIIDNADGTKSLEDVSEYTQRGDSFGAVDINKTNQAVLDLNSSLKQKYEWKTIADEVSGDTIVDISGIEANEFFVRCGTLTTLVPKGLYSIYRDSYYSTSSNYQYLSVNYTETAISLEDYQVNGTSKKSTTKYTVLYR